MVECNKDNWVVIPHSSSSSCSKHNKVFITSERCPMFRGVTLDKRMENDIDKKSIHSMVSSKRYTDLAQSLKETSTKKVVFKHKKVVSSKGVVVNLHEKGCTQKEIAFEIGRSQQYVSKVLNSLKLGTDKRERFHNFSLTFNAIFNFWQFPEKEYKTIKFGHTQYKNWDNGDFHIQIFVNGRIMVRYNKDVFGLKIVRNQDEAIRRMQDFLSDWNKPFNVRFLDYVISTKHNAFVNHPTAKVFKSEFGREMVVRDDSGKVILITDNSHNDKELEYPDRDSCTPLSEHREAYEKDLIKHPNYMPSEVKLKIDEHDSKLDKYLNVLDKFNEKIEWLNVNLVSHEKALNGINSGIESDNIVRVETLNTLKLMQEQMKKEKVRSFIDKYK